MQIIPLTMPSEIIITESFQWPAMTRMVGMALAAVSLCVMLSGCVFGFSEGCPPDQTIFWDDPDLVWLLDDAGAARTSPIPGSYTLDDEAVNNRFHEAKLHTIAYRSSEGRDRGGPHYYLKLNNGTALIDIAYPMGGEREAIAENVTRFMTPLLVEPAKILPPVLAQFNQTYQGMAEGLYDSMEYLLDWDDLDLEGFMAARGGVSNASVEATWWRSGNMLWNHEGYTWDFVLGVVQWEMTLEHDGLEADLTVNGAGDARAEFWEPPVDRVPTLNSWLVAALATHTLPGPNGTDWTIQKGYCVTY